MATKATQTMPVMMPTRSLALAIWSEAWRWKVKVSLSRPSIMSFSASDLNFRYVGSEKLRLPTVLYCRSSVEAMVRYWCLVSKNNGSHGYVIRGWLEMEDIMNVYSTPLLIKS